LRQLKVSIRADNNYQLKKDLSAKRKTGLIIDKQKAAEFLIPLRYKVENIMKQQCN